MDSRDEIVDLDVSDEDALELLESTNVEVAGSDQPLGALVKDIRAAHKELDQFKSGSLALTQALDERITEAERDGDDDLVELLTEIKDTAFAVYLRLQRGDLELLGERDGKHSGYFDDL